MAQVAQNSGCADTFGRIEYIYVYKVICTKNSFFVINTLAEKYLLSVCMFIANCFVESESICMLSLGDS